MITTPSIKIIKVYLPDNLELCEAEPPGVGDVDNSAPNLGVFSTGSANLKSKLPTLDSNLENGDQSPVSINLARVQLV